MAEDTRSVVPENPRHDWKSDVFISHSSNETDVARKLKENLEKEDLKVFIYEDDVPAGCNIQSAVSNAINGCRRCVLLMSKDFLGSNFFQQEYDWAMCRQNELGVVSCIPVLYNTQIEDIPVVFRNVIDVNCLKFDDIDFERKLLKALTREIPIKTQIAVTHTGVGLAWSYFYGYLNIILPGLQQRVIEQQQLNNFECDVFPKFIIILPVSCLCPAEMPEEENFKYKGFIEYKFSRAANKERCYKSTVYDFAFKRGNEKLVHCYLMMEFATPLLSLYEMYEGKVAKLDKAMMTNERHTFKEVIGQILISENMGGKYLLVDFRDEDEQTTSHKWTKETVSEAVTRAVENDMIRDNCTNKYLYPVKKSVHKP